MLILLLQGNSIALLLFTFFLDKKSNKKIKANPIAPLDLPLLTHKFHNYRLWPICDIAIFSLYVISLNLVNLLWSGAASNCLCCRRCPDALLFSSASSSWFARREGAGELN